MLSGKVVQSESMLENCCCIMPSKVPANERRRYICHISSHHPELHLHLCYIFSHWLRLSYPSWGNSQPVFWSPWVKQNWRKIQLTIVCFSTCLRQSQLPARNRRVFTKNLPSISRTRYDLPRQTCWSSGSSCGIRGSSLRSSSRAWRNICCQRAESRWGEWLVHSDGIDHIDCLAQACVISGIEAMEIPQFSINPLWTGDAICWHKSRSTLAQVMACCLTAPSHYLKQCWVTVEPLYNTVHYRRY